VLSGLQHVGLISIFLLFPLLVFREAGFGAEKLRDLLSLSMLALGAGPFWRLLGQWVPGFSAFRLCFLSGPVLSC
jgi:hypothetical protein